MRNVRHFAVLAILENRKIKITSAGILAFLYICRQNTKIAPLFLQKMLFFSKKLLKLAMVCDTIYPSIICDVRSTFDRSVKQRMDDNKTINNQPQDFTKRLQKMDRHTRYVLYERDSGKGRRKVVRFDERYMQSQSSPTLVEDIIAARNMHIALNQALTDLTAEEVQIISECFFEGAKVNYTKLAKKHNISRQVYCRKKNRILNKLKELVISYYNKL